uniref:PRO2225 n=1 Tax=Homo sapiens TaxID=9606 RepID=Q9H392_HUMAN|nr:PRO2225 [Homo sapiens]
MAIDCGLTLLAAHCSSGAMSVFTFLPQLGGNRGKDLSSGCGQGSFACILGAPHQRDVGQQFLSAITPG